MLLIATFLTSHFGEWRQSWHGMPRRARVGGDFDHAVDEDNEGVLAAIDLDTGEVVRSVALDTPAGFATDGDRLYVASMYGNRILVLDSELDIVDTFATRLMNDLHSVTLSDHGLLITSSGTDAVLEISPTGGTRWDWLATEHGFDRGPSGHLTRTARNRDYRLSEIATGMQATHCNSALAATLQGRDVVLATLFHQGQLVALDRSTGHAEVLVRGMRNPHSIRRRPGGWLLSDSRASAAVLLSEDFWVEAVIESDFNWVQDALPLGDNEVLIADANNSRFVIWDLPAGKPARCVGFPSEWKIYQVEVAGPQWEAWLRGEGAACRPS
jgi:hypothetical protein